MAGVLRPGIALLLGLAVSATAGTAAARPLGDGDLTGARFSVSAYANTVRGTPSQRGVMTLKTTGRVRVDGKTRVSVRLVLRSNGAIRSLVADGTRWKLTFAEGRSTLRITLRVAAVEGVPGCVVGSRATLVVVDDDDRLQNGAREDSVRVTFGSPRCRALARRFSNADSTKVQPPVGGVGGGQRANVEILVERA